MEGRKWEDLEMDCLVNIFGRVGMESLLLDVPFVCKSWYKASLNPSCWNHLVFPQMEFDLWCEDSFTDRLMDEYGFKESSINAFIQFIVNRSCKNATILILPRSCTEKALQYAADECPALRALGLRSHLCNIPELMEKWKNLEDLMLQSSYNLKEILTQISLHCKNFKSLTVKNAKIDEDEASAIVTLLPNIKQLLLRGASIDRENLMTILKSCKELVHLDVSHCVGFEVEADDKILELASHIHTFKYEGSILDDYDDYYEGIDHDSSSEGLILDDYDDYYEGIDHDSNFWGSKLNEFDDYYAGINDDSIFDGCYSP